MKIASVVAGVLMASGLAWAFQAKPINDTCPVKGTPIKAGITTSYKGKTVGFC
jgi:hypothetical protein